MLPRLLLLIAALLASGSAWAKPVIAIVDLDNHTGDPQYDPAGPGVAALLVTRFVRTDAVTVVERSRLQEVIGELELGQSGLVDPASAAEVGRLLGAEYLVLGSLFSVNLPTLSVNLRVVDTATGDVVLSDEVVGDVGAQGEDFFVLMDQLAASIVEGLDLELSPKDKVELSQVDVRELEALLAYGRDLDRVPGDLPEALWRDKSRDMMTGAARNQWTVFNNEGTRFPATAFAQTVGDTDALARMEAAKKDSLQRRRTNAGVGWGLTGTGAALLLAGLASDRVPARGASIVGGSLGFVGLSWTMGASLGHSQRVYLAEVPGQWWTPEQADALIDAHNAALD